MTDRNWTSMNEENFDDLINRSFSPPSSNDELVNSNFSLPLPDDELMNNGFIYPPPDAVISAVNPWRKAMNRVLWGLALTTVTFNFLLLDYILPAIGVILMLLGFRSLRRENGWFRTSYILTILDAIQRLPFLVLYATIHHQFVQQFLDSHLNILLTLKMGLSFLQFFCLWRGFKAVQRKAGVPEHAGSAVALMVWYAVIFLLALVNYTGLLVYVTLVFYVLIIRSLFKLSKELDEAGYAIVAAPVRIPDGLLTGIISIVLAIGIFCGYLFAGSYPMTWAQVSSDVHADVVEIKNDLLEQGFPEVVLNDLTAEDIRSCDGALQVVVDNAAKTTNEENGNFLQFTNVAVQLPGEQAQWKIFHHFQWQNPPGCRGTDALRLIPTSYGSKGWTSPGKVAGQVLYTADETTFVSPYHSLTTETYTTNSWFAGTQTTTDTYATFSFPRAADSCRGYVSYLALEKADGYLINSWVEYIHQQRRLQYPVQTAKAYRMSGAWSQRGAFFVIQDALQFSPQTGEK